MKMRVNRSRCALPLILLFVSGCQSNAGNGLSTGERDSIVQEIKQTLEDYRNTALRQDLDASEALRVFMNFYSKDVVLAGDGTILGGYEDWSEQLKRYIQEREKMISWEWRNIHVEVLSNDAATSTFEFEHSEKKKTGETVSVKGAWTYVFKRYDGKWKIIQSNGTHLAF